MPSRPTGPDLTGLFLGALLAAGSVVKPNLLETLVDAARAEAFANSKVLRSVQTCWITGRWTSRSTLSQESADPD